MDILKILLRTAVLAGIIGAMSPGAVIAQETLEQDVKATFLFNFTRFIEWPGQATAGSAPFRLCVLADPLMEQAISRAVQGEVVHGRPLVMTIPQNEQDAAGCHILFVSRSEQFRASVILAAVRDLPVLSVGDSPDFLDQGGTIQFLLVENRVRFDVSLPSAQRANLKFSSNLLRVARTVKPLR